MGKLDVLAVAGISLVFLLGGYFFSIGARNLMRDLASSHWPKTAGVVVRSKTSATVERNRSERTSTTMYSAEITIRYSVNGRDYTTGNRHLGQTFGSGDSSDAELLHYRYPEGAEVQVAYNPRDPSVAATEPGFHMEALWLPGAGLAFIVPAVMFLLLYFGATRTNGLMAVGAAIFAGIFCTIGILFLSASSVNLWRARASQSWPQTTGVIVYGAVDESTAVTRTSDGEAMRSTVSGAHLVFRYEVNGVKHYSNTRRFGQRSPLPIRRKIPTWVYWRRASQTRRYGFLGRAWLFCSSDWQFSSSLFQQ